MGSAPHMAALPQFCAGPSKEATQSLSRSWSTIPANPTAAILARATVTRFVSERFAATRATRGISMRVLVNCQKRFWAGFSAGPGKTCCRNKCQQQEPPVGLGAGSQLKKANGLGLEGPSVGLYVPLLEFNLSRKSVPVPWRMVMADQTVELVRRYPLTQVCRTLPFPAHDVAIL
jgi:hypothetical protein